MEKTVSFKNNEINLAGHLYLPDDIDENKKHPAIVIGHPVGGVKEQVAGSYALKLSEHGFITLTFDASYQGESGGKPRYLEDPASRVEDVRCAVDYLSNHPLVDENRIGGLGICGSGGYVVNAAQTEHRIKAVAGLSSVDIGGLFRDGFEGITTLDERQIMLEEVGKQRTKEANGEPIQLIPIVPDSADELTENTPVLYREAYEYYRTPRAQHPNSPNRMVFTSIDKIMAYSSYDQVDTISPRPLLLIAGSAADSLYFSEEAYKKAKEPKELFTIQGATHIDLYDKPEFVDPAVEKLLEFFGENL
ncbi:alpha/beta hydrolase [uncultured Methanobacterium sp.]|uniref:alpha/beta hydrolase n=1 Tax=uncultured Methanobacterium sp. TaxID=176306 RepID=UPI002AA8FAA9|nr:alpha/beta hydrolase [uncultured Methanobacterium sp.]